jgi:acetyl esterase/lipase
MALVLRKQFADNGKVFGAELTKQAPTDIVAVIDERYGTDSDELLDVYVPAASARAGEKLPTVVWTHGGAWLGGSKDAISGYLRMIAGAGFTVVRVRYSLAPEANYQPQFDN